MKIGIKVDLSQMNMKGRHKDVVKALRRTVKTAAFLGEREMKKIAPVVKGRYRASINTKPQGLKAAVGPNVIYQDWVERGSRGVYIPKTHRNSSFKGHHVVKRAGDVIRRKVDDILKSELRKTGATGGR